LISFGFHEGLDMKDLFLSRFNVSGSVGSREMFCNL